MSTNWVTLIDNQNAIAARIIIKEVNVYQPVNLNLQSSFFVDFPNDSVGGTFINFSITSWQIPAALKRVVGALE